MIYIITRNKYITKPLGAQLAGTEAHKGWEDRREMKYIM